MEILSDPTPDMLAMPRFDDGAIDMQELLRRLAEQVVNAVMDAEADQLCGGGANSRNGYRERSLATCVGTLTLRIPKLRSGSFFPEDVLERYQRVDRALVAAVAEMYATGTSTRKVRRVAEKMGVSRLSKDQVSAIASSLDADIEDLCARPLDGSPVPYVWLDADLRQVPPRGARRLHRRGHRHRLRRGRLEARPGRRRGRHRVLRLVARLPAGYPLARGGGRAARRLGRPPGARPGARRGLPGRRVAALRGPPHARLHARGRLLAAQAPCGQDRLAGVPRARRRHRDRHVPRGLRHAGGVCCPRAAAILEEAEPDALAYLDFPPAHWKRLRTNNVQERTNREIKRRSRVVQVFPSTGSLVRLAGAVMCEQDEIWQESRYFSEARMNELYDDGRTRGIDGTVDWARLEAEARKMLESGLELADRIETA